MNARRAFLTGSFRAAAAAPPVVVEDATAPPPRRIAHIGAACLSVNGVACRMCEEQCEPGAIRFRLALGGKAVPLIDDRRCDGCGACAAPCPVGAVSFIPMAAEMAAETTS